MKTPIRILRGDECRRALADADFLAQWSRLHQQCRWASLYQTADFVQAWMESYRSHYEPILVFQTQAEGELCGLLPLGRSLKAGNWVVAGGHQAEYHAWLAAEEETTAFIEGTLHYLMKQHGLKKIQFRNILDPALLNWTHGQAWKRRITVTPEKRSLIDLAQRSDRGKRATMRTNRNKLNRLRRVGEVRFEQVQNPEEFKAIQPDIECMYDFRLGAAYGARPFQLDQHKGPFHLKMMETPGLLHVTVLKVGEDIVSFHIGNVVRGPILYSGLHSYSPEKARYSPVYLHLEMLASRLAEENYEFLDMGSGDEPYKQLFASKVETVYEIKIYADVWRRCLSWSRKQMLTFIAGILLKAGVSQQALWIAFRSLHPGAWRFGRNAVRRWIERLIGFEHYALDPALARQLPCRPVLNVNSARDLLQIDCGSYDRYQNEFIRSAFKRLSSGQRSYTATRNGRLVFCAWMIPASDSKQKVEKGSPRLPTRVDIQDLYIDGADAEPGFLREALLQLFAESSQYEDARIRLPRWLRSLSPTIALLAGEFGGLLLPRNPSAGTYRPPAAQPTGRQGTSFHVPR
jgi:CelD/BcsL family acetyltransferase involved in cellulose biosynthesis